MGEVVKVLAQVSPAATTQTTLYTVPGATVAVLSSLVVCNQNATSITFRVRIQVGGAANDVKQFIYYDVTVFGGDTFVATIGISLAAADVVTCYASATNVSFNLFGVEVS